MRPLYQRLWKEYVVANDANLAADFVAEVYTIMLIDDRTEK